MVRMRITAVVFTLWALLATPALCMGGVITHVCECAADPTCTCEPGCGEESGCQHESGCSDDPCNIIVARSERQGNDVVAVFQPATGSSTLLCVDEQKLARRFRADVYESSHRKNLPFPCSDLPLLI